MLLKIEYKDLIKQKLYLYSGVLILLISVGFIISMLLNSYGSFSKLNDEFKLISIEYINSIENNTSTEEIVQKIVKLKNSKEYKALSISNPLLFVNKNKETPGDRSIFSELDVINRVIAEYHKDLHKSYRIMAFLIILLISIFAVMTVLFELENYKRDIESKIKLDVDKKLFSLLEMEKRMISGELHDDVGQKLGLIKQHFITNPGNPILEGYVTSVIEKVRDLSHFLRGPEFESLTFSEQIQLLVSDFITISPISIQFSSPGLNRLVLDENRALHSYRIIQELLSNATKHSQATFIKLTIIYSHPNLVIKYSDNGVGCVDSNCSESNNLCSIKYRTSLMDGEIDFPSQENGYSVTIKIPVFK